MKNILAAIIFVVSFINLTAQIDLTSGMGISFQSTPSLKDYIDNLAPAGEELAQYSSAVTFFGEIDYSMSPTFDLGVEYENKLFSYNTSFGGLGTYDLSYTSHSPSLLAFYVVQGAGYKFKFGGGVGYRIISVDEELPTSNSVIKYTANGFGIVLKTIAHTLLGGDFYASIGADLRYDIVGEASNNGTTLGAAGLKEEVDFNTLAFGVKIGVSYFIR